VKLTNRNICFGSILAAAVIFFLGVSFGEPPMTTKSQLKILHSDPGIKSITIGKGEVICLEGINPGKAEVAQTPPYLATSKEISGLVKVDEASAGELKKK
jgi:hypothetical protein